jgi:hypothetical protein
MNDAIFCRRAELPMRTPLAIRETEILEKALAASLGRLAFNRRSDKFHQIDDPRSQHS